MRPRVPLRLVTSAVSAALVAACLVQAGPALSKDRLSWSDNEPIPTPRHEFATALVGRDVYVMAGFVGGASTVPTVEVYDTKADSWASAPPLPYAPNHAMGAAHRGIPYILGGYVAALSLPSDMFMALADGGWIEMPEMPEARAAGATAMIKDKLYVVGGIGPNGVVDEMLIFDFDNGQWSTEPGPPMAREHLGVVAKGPFLYAIGGRVGSPDTNMSIVDRLDTRTGKWKSLTPLPYTTSGHAVTVTKNGYIVVLGGEGASGSFSDAFAYDIAGDSWVKLPQLDPPRTGFGAVAIGTRVHAIGGSDKGLIYLTTNESIDLGALP